MTIDSHKLALAAARTRDLAAQLSDTGRDLLIAEWSALLETLETASASDAECALAEFRAGVDERLSVKRLHRPLEEISR